MMKQTVAVLASSALCANAYFQAPQPQFKYNAVELFGNNGLKHGFGEKLDLTKFGPNSVERSNSVSLSTSSTSYKPTFGTFGSFGSFDNLGSLQETFGVGRADPASMFESIISSPGFGSL